MKLTKRYGPSGMLEPIFTLPKVIRTITTAKASTKAMPIAMTGNQGLR